MAHRRPHLRFLLVTVGLLTLALVPSGTTSAAPLPNGLTAFCSRVIQKNVGPFPAKAIGASSGAQMACFGPQHTGPLSVTGSLATGQKSAFSTTTSSSPSGSSKNVDAASPSEDVTQNGTRAYGQSEESVAAAGPYVVEAWNDATGFFQPCPDPSGMNKEELTGLGFSSNGGASFTDLGGLPNDCTTGYFYFGDPTVEAFQTGRNTFFYIASLYINVNTGESDLELDACQATGTTLACAMPTRIATGAPGDFLDKEFMTVDPVNKRLYISYTRFGLTANTSNGQIELAKCDISPGLELTPACNPGTSPTPYFVVSPGDSNCEQEGAYPAVDTAPGATQGDVYVAWEFNWASNFSVGACTTQPVQNRVAHIPFTCLTQPVASCAGPTETNAVAVTSMDLAFIPGYNRFPMNDFPRIAVSHPYGTVSIVWNDARHRVLGDIFLESFTLSGLTPLQPTAPVPLDSFSKGGAYFLPALRNASASGKLNVTFYQRGDPNTAQTDVYANTGVVPTITSGSSTNTRVTNTTSDWNNVSSDIIPNFGDYTDNYVIATPTAPFTDKTLYVAWADGRLGVPNPFEATLAGS